MSRKAERREVFCPVPGAMVRPMWTRFTPPDGLDGSCTPVRCSRYELCRRENADIDADGDCRLNHPGTLDGEAGEGNLH